MDIAVNAVSRVIRAYQNQAKIAERVQEGNIKVVQGQNDRVTISTKAKEMLVSRPREAAPEQTAGQTVAPEDI